MRMSRKWAMPNKFTFQICCIKELIFKYKLECPGIWIDPFAGSSQIAELNNDLNPEFGYSALDAEKFINNHEFDHVLFDPPYSPRQIAECYKSVGKRVDMKKTQNALLYSRVRNAVTKKIKPRSIVISFGWNSNGFGKTKGYEIIEILLVAHGGAHNDTIVVVEVKK